jgi:hypothetical protein
MIPNDAVEAAALALFERDYGVDDWGITNEQVKAAYLDEARAALEAAAPYMHDRAAETRLLAIAWTEAYQAGFQEGAGFGPTPNPHRSQA